MSKIFIFGIGGTGSRVLKSLTMMLASGVKFGADEIVPIIVDPDAANANLTQTVSLLNSYNTIREDLSFSNENKNRFFLTTINKVIPNYTLLIDDTSDKTFEQFIGYASMSKANKALSKMLFSDKNLNSSMELGFKGNPNIGCVVLNQFANSDDFIQIANLFSEGDKIFIVSSIFGGTGASGFPLLLKTLREGKDFPNYDLINKASIGAITIMPYFKLNRDENSEIDSSTFISKTKSALAYYENNISKNGIINALYYLADDVANVYENHQGGTSQNNAAHLIEFLGATAIVDFSNSYFDSTSHLELGIKENTGTVTFNSFYSKMYEMLYYPLTQLTMTHNALITKLDYYKSNTFNPNKADFKDLYSTQFFKNFTSFLKLYETWLTEMKGNKRSLDLFNMNCGNKPFDLVTDKSPQKILSIFSDYTLVSARLCDVLRKCNSKKKEDKFLEMFFLGTEKLISEKLSN